MLLLLLHSLYIKLLQHMPRTTVYTLLLLLLFAATTVAAAVTAVTAVGTKERVWAKNTLLVSARTRFVVQIIQPPPLVPPTVSPPVLLCLLLYCCCYYEQMRVPGACLVMTD